MTADGSTKGKAAVMRQASYFEAAEDRREGIMPPCHPGGRLEATSAI